MREIADHLLDILQNAITAGANQISIEIATDLSMDVLKLVVKDNGSGMSEEFAKLVINPFVSTRKTRKVGLGIPLFKEAAQRAGGDLKIESQIGIGTKVAVEFQVSHIDRVPLGNIAQTVISMIFTSPSIQLKLQMDDINHGRFVFDLENVREIMGTIPITQFDVLDWIKITIQDGTKSIFGGVLNEVI